MGKSQRVETPQVAAVVDPEIDREEIEAAARFALPFGNLADHVEDKRLGLVEAATGPGAKRLEDGIGLVVPAHDAAHAAAQVFQERGAGLRGRCDAVDRLHAQECAAGRNSRAGIMPQFEPSFLGRRPACRMGQGEKELIVEIEREPLLAHARSVGRHGRCPAGRSTNDSTRPRPDW